MKRLLADLRNLINRPCRYDIQRLYDRLGEQQVQIDELRSYLGTVEARLGTTNFDLALLGDQVGLFKSSFDIDPSLEDEYLEWKRSRPLRSQPLVSVALIATNYSAQLFETCLPSVLSQDYCNFEILIVGVGCTSETVDRIANLGDPRIKFYVLPAPQSTPKSGVEKWGNAASALEALKSLIDGDSQYVAYLHGYEEFVPNRLSKLVELASANDCDLVWHPFWQQERGGWALREAPTFAYTNPSSVTTSTTMFRTWFVKLGPDPKTIKLQEPLDWNFLRKIRYMNVKMMRCPEPLSRIALEVI